MSELLEWSRAYVLTQIVEVPVYLYAARRLRPARRWLFAIGASTITHPVLWFLFPWEDPHYLEVLIAGESFVIITEGLWGKGLHVPRPWLWSFVANAASMTTGFAMQAMLK